ncbi:hypothetical protein K503DRAFT_718861 [Rhizopogon vinicolor AM-OR11-026]|uniref:Uncharacterized protein n=1 Tax=Rhizopogon vinicolor AM-OR11-026 TaxID=1314800 RepID=A0A1B7MZL3_9AGAM|nr:hypothetical protein K503DRAFT_718861 [Rhizopogon vinicolor AM-OR11-026]
MRFSLTRRQSPPPPADIIAYSLNNRMVYVPKAQTFDEAVTFARSAFESDLKGVDKSQISFSMISSLKNDVGISSMAWPTIMSKIVHYSIVYVHVQSGIKSLASPPSYAD